MKLTEKNITKHLKDHQDLINKCKSLFKEMGIDVFQITDNNISFSLEKEGMLSIYDAASKKTFDVQLSYLLDKADTHTDEYLAEIERKRELERIRFQKYVK